MLAHAEFILFGVYFTKIHHVGTMLASGGTPLGIRWHPLETMKKTKRWKIVPRPVLAGKLAQTGPRWDPKNH